MFLALALIILTACGRQVTIEGTVTATNNSEGTPAVINSESATEIMETTEIFDLSDVSPIEALRKVLLNEAPFCCINTVPYANKNIIHEYNGYLNELEIGGKSIKTPQFTILDLDGDEVPEVVLAIENYNGSVILRYRDGKVLGNIIGYRSMYNLKKDGSFNQSGSAFESYISKLFFVDRAIVDDENAIRIETINETYYYLHDIPVDKNMWDKLADSFEKAELAEWHDFSVESINQWVVEDDSVPTENERQDYLDSLAYLLELTYDYTSKGQEEFNIDSKQYYYGCKDELNKIYQLCMEKLSGNKLEELEAEQQHWQETIEHRLLIDLQANQVSDIEELDKWTIYYTYGDMLLRRTIHLINVYYDVHFYD